jgi:hypothetical protein
MDRYLLSGVIFFIILIFLMYNKSFKAEEKLKEWCEKNGYRLISSSTDFLTVIKGANKRMIF